MSFEERAEQQRQSIRNGEYDSTLREGHVPWLMALGETATLQECEERARVAGINWKNPGPYTNENAGRNFAPVFGGPESLGKDFAG